jgi:hypothetical protein
LVKLTISTRGSGSGTGGKHKKPGSSSGPGGTVTPPGSSGLEGTGTGGYGGSGGNNITTVVEFDGQIFMS